jgi:hypothetical protein
VANVAAAASQPRLATVSPRVIQAGLPPLTVIAAANLTEALAHLGLGPTQHQSATQQQSAVAGEVFAPVAPWGRAQRAGQG